jgi:hypothetical protein
MELGRYKFIYIRLFIGIKSYKYMYRMHMCVGMCMHMCVCMNTDVCICMYIYDPFAQARLILGFSRGTIMELGRYTTVFMYMEVYYCKYLYVYMTQIDGSIYKYAYIWLILGSSRGNIMELGRYTTVFIYMEVCYCTCLYICIYSYIQICTYKAYIRVLKGNDYGIRYT